MFVCDHSFFLSAPQHNTFSPSMHEFDAAMASLTKAVSEYHPSLQFDVGVLVGGRSSLRATKRPLWIYDRAQHHLKAKEWVEVCNRAKTDKWIDHQSASPRFFKRCAQARKGVRVHSEHNLVPGNSKFRKSSVVSS